MESPAAPESAQAKSSCARAVLLDLALLLAAALVCYLPNLSAEYRWASHEDRHTLIAAEMAETGDYFFPTLLGEPYSYKPPVLHSAAVSLFSVFGGPSMLLARLPSVVAAAIAIGALYGIGRQLATRSAALLTSLVLVVIPGWSNMARQARPDMILAMAIVTASFLLLAGMSARRAFQRAALFAGAGLACGLGVLTKGPYGILFPLTFAIVAPFEKRTLSRPSLREWSLFGALVLLLPLGWALPVYLRDSGVYLKSVLFNKDLTEGAAGHSRPFYWYLGTAVSSTTPWFLLLPVAYEELRRRFSASAVTSIAILVVLSCVPGKRLHYLLPWYPFAALAGVSAATRLSPRFPWVTKAISIGAAAALLCTSFYFGFAEKRWFSPIEPRCELARALLSQAPTNSNFICLDGASEAIALVGRIEYGHRRGRVRQRKPSDDLAAEVERARHEQRPCILLVPDEHLQLVRAQLADYPIVTIFHGTIEERSFEGWRIAGDALKK
ncbi:MAG: glycosyltransferase family 39 protein [Planctomycetes bacterium]|nr:glycosyltransferase family 39 protein [Planctomycetota bacterium]